MGASIRAGNLRVVPLSPKKNIKVRRMPKMGKDKKNDFGISGNIVTIDAMHNLKNPALLTTLYREASIAAGHHMNSVMLEVWEEGQDSWPELSERWKADKKKRGANDEIMDEFSFMRSLVEEDGLINFNPAMKGLVYEWPRDIQHPSTKGLSVATLAHIHETGQYSRGKAKPTGKGVIAAKRGGRARPWLSVAISRGFHGSEEIFIGFIMKNYQHIFTAIKEKDLDKAARIGRSVP